MSLRTERQAGRVALWLASAGATLAVVGVALWWMAANHTRPAPAGPILISLEDAQREHAYLAGRRMERDLASEIERANGMAASGDTRGAIAALVKVAARAAVPAVYNNIGVLYSRMGDVLNAREAFAAALQRQPRYEATIANLRLLPSGPQTELPVIQEVEPNNSNGRANTIKLEVPVTATIADLSDVDFFRFTCPSGTRDLVEITVESRSAEFIPAWRLYDSDNRLTQSGKEQIKPGDTGRQVFSPDPGSPSFVEIFGKNRTTGAYTITVKALHSFDRYEPNEDVAHAVIIQPGTAIEAGIMDGRDEDYFRFPSPRTGRVEVSIADPAPTLIPALSVMGPDMRLVGFGPEVRTGGQSVSFGFEAHLGETYYVQVWSKGTSGGYRLLVK
jgi:hypothetical protein